MGLSLLYQQFRLVGMSSRFREVRRIQLLSPGRASKTRSGVTLVEMVMVISILAIALTTVTANAYSEHGKRRLHLRRN